MNAAPLAPAPRGGGLRAAVDGVDRLISAASIVAALGALVVMLFALLAEVVVRYATKQGMGWPGELPSLLFPWLVMGGVVLAAQRGQHIAVTAIIGFLGQGGRRVLLLALHVLVAVTFFYLAWIGMEVIEITGSEVYPVTGVRAHWAYLALIVGFVGLGLTALTTLVHLLLADDPLSVRAHRTEDEL